MTITFKVNDTNLRRKVNRLVKDLGDTRVSQHPLQKLDKFKKRALSADWRNASVKGATVQGARWPALRPPPDPPWGGRAKKRGKGVTLGRKRPSGNRVTPNSRLLIDTWRLFRAVINAPVDIKNNTLRLGRFAAQAVPYARIQFAAYPRGYGRILRWTAADQRYYKQESENFLKRYVARRWNEDRGARRTA